MRRVVGVVLVGRWLLPDVAREGQAMRDNFDRLPHAPRSHVIVDYPPVRQPTWLVVICMVGIALLIGCSALAIAGLVAIARVVWGS